MSNKSTTQCVKIQIEKKVTEKQFDEMEVIIPSYYALMTGELKHLTLKVCSESEFIVVTNDQIALHNIRSLYIWLTQPLYKPCKPEIFYQHLAEVSGKIQAISGINYLTLQHELTDEDYQQIKYDEGRDLINEDRRDRDENRKDDISHDWNH